jgi:Uma2 family endonuclease
MPLAKRDAHHHTYGDYVQWPDDTRWELIDGQAFAMSPAPTLDHQSVVGEIFGQLFVQLRGKRWRPFVAPCDVLLPRNQEADATVDTCVQPDVFVVCDPAKLNDKCVRGAPDFVLEVLSPATASHDQVLKRRRYEQAGVREFWLLHPTDRVLTIYRLLNGEYGKPDMQALEGETDVQVLDGVRIDWAPVNERLGPQEL